MHQPGSSASAARFWFVPRWDVPLLGSLGLIATVAFAPGPAPREVSLRVEWPTPEVFEWEGGFPPDVHLEDPLQVDIRATWEGDIAELDVGSTAIPILACPEPVFDRAAACESIGILRGAGLDADTVQIVAPRRLRYEELVKVIDALASMRIHRFRFDTPYDSSLLSEPDW